MWVTFHLCDIDYRKQEIVCNIMDPKLHILKVGWNAMRNFPINYDVGERWSKGTRVFYKETSACINGNLSEL